MMFYGGQGTERNTALVNSKALIKRKKHMYYSFVDPSIESDQIETPKQKLISPIISRKPELVIPGPKLNLKKILQKNLQRIPKVDKVDENATASMPITSREHKFITNLSLSQLPTKGNRVYQMNPSFDSNLLSTALASSTTTKRLSSRRFRKVPIRIKPQITSSRTERLKQVLKMRAEDISVISKSKYGSAFENDLLMEEFIRFKCT